MDVRKRKIISSRAGGSSSKNSKTYKISLPTSWVSKLGVSEDKKEVMLYFSDDEIIIKPNLSLDEFIKKAKSKHHNLLQLDYYDRDTLCTVIVANYTAKEVKFVNLTDNAIKRAFGILDYVTWEKYENFLEERCVPKNRANIKDYLKGIGLLEYNPLEIIMKTQGIMAEDEQWIEVKRL